MTILIVICGKLLVFIAALSCSPTDVCSECCRVKVGHPLAHPPPYIASVASRSLPPNTTMLSMSPPPPSHPSATGAMPPQLPPLPSKPPMYPPPIVPSPMPPFTQSLSLGLPSLSHAMTPPVSSAAVTDSIMRELGLPTCEAGYVSPSGTHKPSATLCYTTSPQQPRPRPQQQPQPESGCNLLDELDLFIDPPQVGGGQGGAATATASSSFPGDFSEIKDIPAGSPHSDVTCYSPVTTPISPNSGEQARICAYTRFLLRIK